MIVHYNEFPNLGVFHATFPHLKGPRALHKIAEYIPDCTKSNWKNPSVKMG